MSTRPRPSATSCFHLLLPPLIALDFLRDATRPRCSLTLWFSLPLAPLLSLSLTAAQISRCPPLQGTALTAVSLPRGCDP